MKTKKISKRCRAKMKFKTRALYMFSVAIIALLWLASCMENALDTEIEERNIGGVSTEIAKNQCGMDYLSDETQCWDGPSTPEDFRQAALCSHKTQKEYFECLKKDNRHLAKTCDHFIHCNQRSIECYSACVPNNHVQDESCIEGCVETMSECYFEGVVFQTINVQIPNLSVDE